MSVERKKRLAKLVRLQNRLKQFHETRHAGHLAGAARAAAEAEVVRQRFDDPDSLSGLFPEIYHRRVEAFVAERDRNLGLAAEEAPKVAAATVRAARVEERYREAARAVDESAAAKELQELVDRLVRQR